MGDKQLLKRKENKREQNQDVMKIAWIVKGIKVLVLTIKSSSTSKSHLFHSSKLHFCMK